MMTDYQVDELIRGICKGSVMLADNAGFPVCVSQLKKMYNDIGIDFIRSKFMDLESSADILDLLVEYLS